MADAGVNEDTLYNNFVYKVKLYVKLAKIYYSQGESSEEIKNKLTEIMTNLRGELLEIVRSRTQDRMLASFFGMEIPSLDDLRPRPRPPANFFLHPMGRLYYDELEYNPDVHVHVQKVNDFCNEYDIDEDSKNLLLGTAVQFKSKRKSARKTSTRKSARKTSSRKSARKTSSRKSARKTSTRKSARKTSTRKSARKTSSRKVRKN
jgi:hypothetical protein